MNDNQLYFGVPGPQEDPYLAALYYSSTPELLPKKNRFKESCDRCSSAKVRCSRDKPGCKRCADRDVECVYSLSQRGGRRKGPRQRKRSASNSSAEVDPVPSPPPSTAGGSEVYSSPPMTHAPAAEDGQANISTDVPDFWSSNLHVGDYPVQCAMEDALYGLQNYNVAQPLPMPTRAPSSTFHEDSWPMETTNLAEIVPPKPKRRKATQHVDPFAGAGGLVTPAASSDSSRSSSSTNDTLSEQTSSVDTGPIDNVHKELLNLTEFAMAMEQKFDAIVRQRTSHRSMSPKDLGLPSLGPGTSSALQSNNDRAFEPLPLSRSEPDELESAYYCSLSELRRRLKWLGEDVGNIVSPVVAGV